jgi:hypothetical protein
MHADKLYHQMLDYERRVEEARAAGLEPPPITSLFNPNAKPVPRNDSDKLVIPGSEQLPPGFKPSKPWEDLTPHERELEIRSFKAEMEQKKVYADVASPFLKKQDEARSKRQEKMVSWFGETVGRWLA